MNNQRNYGLKIDEQNPEDYVFGVSPVPFEILQPDGDWTKFLPQKELQNLNGIEPYACVSFTILNCIEILIQQQYGEEVNYSDRFLAAVSGTKEGGNSAQIVCEFLRKVGVVKEDLWPFGIDIYTFEKFYEPLPPKLYELAKEFNEKWDFKHEYVPNNNEDIQKALLCSPLGISVVAWYEKGGKYYKPEGAHDNHFTTLIKARPNEYKRVFDSYDNFIKDYEWNTAHAVIKRFYVDKKPESIKNEPIKKNESWLRKIWGCWYKETIT